MDKNEISCLDISHQVEEKTSDKTIVNSLIRLVTIAVMCLIIMTVSAYAYFTSGITSAANVIKTSSFETVISVKESSQADNAPIETTVLSITKDVLYEVNIKLAETNTAKSGYIVIASIDGPDRYHTQQLGVDGDTRTEEISFFITADYDTEIEFISNWGTSTYYTEYKSHGDTEFNFYVTSGETIVFKRPVQDEKEGVENSPESTKTNVPEQSTTEETTNKSPETTNNPEEIATPPTDTTDNNTNATETTYEPETAPPEETTEKDKTEDDAPKESPETTGESETTDAPPSEDITTDTTGEAEETTTGEAEETTTPDTSGKKQETTAPNITGDSEETTSPITEDSI